MPPLANPAYRATERGGRGYDAVFGIEARGFIAASALAHEIGAGFVPVRAPGKLPSDVLEIALPDGCAHGTLEVHADALVPGQRVLLVGGGCHEGCTDAVERALTRAGLDVHRIAERSRR
jgi:adenine phosphoribosyltransferase